MTKAQQMVIVSVAGGLGWLATQKVREKMPGAVGVAMGALVGMVVQTAAGQWLEQNL